jgi:hypothetical protein
MCTTIAGALALIALASGCAPKYRPLPDVVPGDPPGGQPIPAADAKRDTDAQANPAPAAAPPKRGAKSPDGKAAWPFWPAHMRLHPLTRLTGDTQTGEQIIECRIEFEDPDHQTCRAVGQLTLQLYPDSAAATGSRNALQTWNQDLRDLELNRRQYDDVTRTYLFRLQLTQPPPAGSELRAYFLSSDGKRMNAEMRLRQ